MEIIDEIGGIPYWVRESEMDPEFVHKEVLGREPGVTNFIQSYLYQFFDNSHCLKTSLKPLRKPFDKCQSCLEAINNGWDIKQIN